MAALLADIDIRGWDLKCMLQAAGSTAKLDAAQWLLEEGADWPIELRYNYRRWPRSSVNWAREQGCAAPTSIALQEFGSSSDRDGSSDSSDSDSRGSYSSDSERSDSSGSDSSDSESGNSGSRGSDRSGSDSDSDSSGNDSSSTSSSSSSSSQHGRNRGYVPPSRLQEPIYDDWRSF
jgi:hypothetical protein